MEREKRVGGVTWPPRWPIARSVARTASALGRLSCSAASPQSRPPKPPSMRTPMWIGYGFAPPHVAGCHGGPCRCWRLARWRSFAASSLRQSRQAARAAQARCAWVAWVARVLVGGIGAAHMWAWRLKLGPLERELVSAVGDDLLPAERMDMHVSQWAQVWGAHAPPIWQALRDSLCRLCEHPHCRTTMDHGKWPFGCGGLQLDRARGDSDRAGPRAGWRGPAVGFRRVQHHRLQRHQTIRGLYETHRLLMRHHVILVFAWVYFPCTVVSMARVQLTAWHRGNQIQIRDH